MYEIATDTLDQSPVRVLRWPRVLHRLRPVRLAIVARELRNTFWQAQALGLVEQHFPNSLAAFNPRRHTWEDIFREFLHLVEVQEWFEIDWERLNELYHWAMSDYREDGIQTDGEFNMAEYLVGIPVMTFGWGLDRLLNEDEHIWAPLLAGLLTDKIDVRADLLCTLEIYDNLNGVTREDLWRRLDSGHFERYREPLCWLPDVAKIVCGLTGNDILDHSSDFWDHCPHHWTWADDIEEVQALWAEAEPTIKRYRQFCDWALADDEHLMQIVDALVGWNEVDDDDE